MGNVINLEIKGKVGVVQTQPGSTAEVIQIIEHQPHNSGPAVCLNCQKKWVAVAPAGTISFECPECGIHKGVFEATCMPESVWTCKCGCCHMVVSGLGNIICVLCGLTQTGVFE